MDVRREAVTDPLIIEEAGELSVTLLFIESFIFGIAHRADRPLCEKPTANGSVERGELRGRRETVLAREALPTDALCQGEGPPDCTADR